MALLVSDHMDAYRALLYDFGLDIKTSALDAKARRDAAARGSADHTFEAGRVLAFNEVISMLQNRAAALGLPLSDLRLEGFDPDRELT